MEFEILGLNYKCPSCKSTWLPNEVSDEFMEHEGCPDCLTNCERCGMVKDYHGTFEHCL